MDYDYIGHLPLMAFECSGRYEVVVVAILIILLNANYYLVKKISCCAIVESFVDLWYLYRPSFNSFLWV